MRPVCYVGAVSDVRGRYHQRADQNGILRAPDPKAGSCGTLVDLFALPYNHRPTVVSGVMEEAVRSDPQRLFRAAGKARRKISGEIGRRGRLKI